MQPELLRATDLSWCPDSAVEGQLRLENLSIRIRGGDRFVLSGPSGCGKSTFLRCIVGLEARTGGTLWWRGSEVFPERMRAFRRDVAYLPQKSVPVLARVGEELEFARRMAAFRENVEFPRKAALTRREQWRLLDLLGLGKIPESRLFEHLSVGEQQRLCLVRSLTLSPSVLLLDEPTASLDPKSTLLVEDLLDEYIREGSGDRAFLWVSHSEGQVSRVEAREIQMSDLRAWPPEAGA